MAFIDIHGHYAWDIDDGMPSLEDAKKALEKAKNNRISTIVATPHVVSGKHTLKDLEIIKDRIHDLKELAKVYNIEVLEGCELFLNHDYLEALEQNIFIPIENTHYLLVEFDVRKELGNENEVEDRLYEIQYKGYTPVIAHVERYFKDSFDIERIQDFIDNGYLIQVNATSFLGYHGKHAQKFAYQLLNQGLLHVIATDTHRCDGHRSPCLQEVFDLLVKKYMSERFHSNNPTMKKLILLKEKHPSLKKYLKGDNYGKKKRVKEKH